MNIIALGKEAQHVCLRYRIDPVRQAMRQQGQLVQPAADAQDPVGPHRPLP